MSMRINTNIAAFNAQRNLSATAMAYSKSVERLSSGLRINRAGDDAAGLSISEKLRAQVRGVAQAQRNAQDAISMIQTAEGALNEVHAMLQRMRELAVQAANDTLSTEDRAAINRELQQLKTEIDATRDRTRFNGKQLLSGSLVTELDATSELKVGSLLGTNGDAIVTSINVASAQPGQTYTFTSAAAGTLTLTRSGDGWAQTISVADLAANETGTLSFDALGVTITLQAANNAKVAADIITDLTAAANDTIVTAAGSGSANFQIGPNASDAMTVSFQEVSVEALGLSNGNNLALDDFNADQSVANAQALITAIDTAINIVSTNRSELGASQNRLEHTIANLGVAQENLSASESRIRDADMASEMVAFTRNQILQQAGTAILAQANQAPNAVLSLLR